MYNKMQGIILTNWGAAVVLKNGYVQLGQCVTAVEVEFLDTVRIFIHTIYFFIIML
jgi:hypothetical protein